MLASSIELVDYQFEVIRRVLTDPVQRYLLADEVGLGKTIEAGVIIRQYFLDAPDGFGVVIVPRALVSQWREELSDRFALADWLDDALHVVCHDDLDNLREVLPRAGLLVVDEAHHLSRLANEKGAELYQLLRDNAMRIPRLLLLSATPVLSDPQGFLRILHLLDPVTFSLDDFNAFQRRISTRQIIAEVVAALVPQNLWGLPGELDRLKEAYGDDHVLMEKIDALRAVIDTFPDEQDEDYTAAISDLKTHLVETYRLHRRLLRNRRAAVQWATPKRAGLKRVSFRGEETERWRRRIEEFRQCLSNLDTLPDLLRFTLLECAVNGRQATSFLKLLEQHNMQDEGAREIAAALDNSAARTREGQARFDVLADLVRHALGMPAAQVVVFCTQQSDADRAASFLHRMFGEQVVRHEVMTDFEEGAGTALPWQKFLSAPQKVRVLVCDASAEEGVNLHGGKKIAIHFDMPATPNRCEQRLGRLDRFGTGDPILSYALQDDANPDEVAWIDTLDTGWQVFDRSVASLQYLIESASQKLSEDWLLEGTQAIQRHLAWLAGPEGRVQRELKQIDQQDALDALSEQESDAFDLLTERDQAWREWRTAFKGFAVGALGFQVHREGPRPANDDADAAFRIGYVPSSSGGMTLIPLRGYLSGFLQSIDVTAPNGSSRSPLTYPYVFRRQHALTRTTRAQGVRVLRVGDPFVAALEQFSAQDDRGRAFAMWRVDRSYDVKDPSGADLYFRFDFVIRPDLNGQEDSESEADDDVTKRALLRQSQAYFPPLFVRIWMDGTGAVMPGPTDLLAAPYDDSWKDGRRDFNLNPQRWRGLPSSVQSTWMRNWATRCGEARKGAEAAALQSADCDQHVARALKALDREFRIRRAQAESRLARLDGPQRRQALDEMSTDDALHVTMRNALARPVLDLDVAGAVFLASEGLSES